LATVQEKKKENQDDRNAKQNVLDLYKKGFPPLNKLLSEKFLSLIGS